MKKSVWTICFALFWTVLTPAQAQQKENLKQIEDYLNNIKTMQASFVQTASNGNTAEGMLYIAKPNKNTHGIQCSDRCFDCRRRRLHHLLR